MTRLRLAFVIGYLLVLSSGCRMCASKFDYCGPTVMGGCGEECGLCAPPLGIDLTGASQQTVYEEGAVIESEPTIPGELGRNDFEAPIMPRQMVEGQEIEGVIISIQDGKVEESTVPQTLDVSDAKPAPSPSASSGGWSVKRQ